MATHPIAQLTASRFGPFDDVNIDLSRNLNVVVGDNAAGKSQLLKLLYSGTKVLHDADQLTKRDLNTEIAAKLDGVFRPTQLGRLTRRARGRTRAEVGIKYQGISNPLVFSFASTAKREVATETYPAKDLPDSPVFLPTHELLSLGSSFLALYDSRETNFEETWRDTVQLLQIPALRGPRGKDANTLVKPFSALLQGGTVFEEGGRFFLRQPGIGNLEATLLAEGHRKLAMIVRLISSGVLLNGGYLFWDEPEANLNPASQKAVAHALIHLAKSGSQIFVATHSMFILRELQMSSSDENFSTRYIGLTRDQSGDDASSADVQVSTANDLDDLDFIAALEAEAEQSLRYLSR
ncbi:MULTISPECIES: AAA family ATPase [Actinomycetes]